MAERTIDSLRNSNSSCREELEDSLEKPSASLSSSCRDEVRKVLEEGQPVVSALTAVVLHNTDAPPIIYPMGPSTVV